jgi:hypothetical protein
MVEVDTSAAAAAREQLSVPGSRPLRRGAERATTCDKRQVLEHQFE